MKYFLTPLRIAAIAGLLLAAPFASAHSDVSWSLSVGGGAPAPVYAPPPTVYVAPQPVYVRPAPVYVRPAPVYVQPAATVIEYGPSYYMEGREPYHHRHHHWKHH